MAGRWSALRCLALHGPDWSEHRVVRRGRTARWRNASCRCALTGSSASRIARAGSARSASSAGTVHAISTSLRVAGIWRAQPSCSIPAAGRSTMPSHSAAVSETSACSPPSASAFAATARGLPAWRRRPIASRCARSCFCPARSAMCRRRPMSACTRSGWATAPTMRKPRATRHRICRSSSGTSGGWPNTPSIWAAPATCCRCR